MPKQARNCGSSTPGPESARVQSPTSSMASSTSPSSPVGSRPHQASLGIPANGYSLRAPRAARCSSSSCPTEPVDFPFVRMKQTNGVQAPPAKVTAVIFAGASMLAVSFGLPSAAWYAHADDSSVAAKNPYERDSVRTAAGRGLFNQYCAHCHGPNAVSPDPPRDLRRLKHRYAEKTADLF